MASLEPASGQRLAAICRRYDLDERAGAALAELARTLAGDPHAPTAVREIDAILDRHIADSLVALELERVRGAATIADLGAGAGFPGLALAAALPAAEVRLVESVSRKATFIREAAAAAGLANARVIAARAEDWDAGRGGNEVVTARALAPLAVICEYAAPLLEVGGALVAWKGDRDEIEESRARAAALELGLELAEIRAVRPFEDTLARNLHVYLKVRVTPDRFPRRAGIARKRPLGG